MNTFAEPGAAVPTAAPSCPRCDGRPHLEQFRRYEVQTFDPLWFCPRCYGFWAVGDALARGVADPYDEHPALRAFRAPRACRTCAKPLKPDGTCPRCGVSAMLPVPCPSCNAVMQADNRGGITLDYCPSCRGTWFDTGEIVARFGLVPVQGLAASTVDETAPDPVPSTLIEIAFLLLRALILRF